MRFDLSDLRYVVMFAINHYATAELMLSAIVVAMPIGRLRHSFRPFLLCVAALALIHGITTADSLVGYDLFSIPAQYEMN